MAAAILLARGLAPDVDAALALVRERRPVASPTRVDLAFLRAVSPALRDLQVLGQGVVGEPRRVHQPQAS
jgi:hypothetical protein